MARVRTGGAGSGYAWALVIFGAGFVISMLLAIVFWAQLGGARATAQDAQEALARFANANERNDATLTARATNGQTVVGALAGENEDLKEMIGGDAELTFDALKAQKEGLGLGNLAFTSGVQSLQADIQALRQQVEAANAKVQTQTDRADAAVQAQEALSQQYQQSVQQLEQQITQLNTDLAAYRGKGDEMVTNATQLLNDLRREKDNLIAQLRVELGQITSERDQLRQLLNDLTRVDAEMGGKITRPDGEITSIAEENRVFINRGDDDRILLGMTFEIFDAGDLVQLGEGDISNTQLRGKATIEVIDVQDSTSLARVVRQQPGTNLSIGDQLVNLVYDPEATYKFFVYGDYDIDATGQPQVTDRRRIENMITRWGGTLAQALSYDVDFLILGAEPPLPEALPPGIIDPVRIAQNVEAQRNYQTYQQLVGEARDMGIPILNQNRFLALVGYYQR